MARNDVIDFAGKLRLTAGALGCSGHKDLCARFRAVNPATHFDLERAEKWLQGRALPRSAGVYDDWARLLGTGRPGSWLAACSVAEFLAELSRLFGLSAEELTARTVSRAGAPPGSRPFGWHLLGSYACYSLAWSPYWQGQLIRGAMRIEPGLRRHMPMAATYTETLLGSRVTFEGEAQLAGRALHVHLREPQSDLPLFVSLAMPGPPSSAVCGVMSGATLVGPDPRPSATRFVMVRVAEPPDASNGYLEAAPDAVSYDLASLGLPIPDGAETASLILGFLRPEGVAALMQVAAEEQAMFAATFDRLYVRKANQAGRRTDPLRTKTGSGAGRKTGGAASATPPAGEISPSAGSPTAPTGCPGDG